MRNSQHFGATVALIADYLEEPLEYIIMEDMAGATDDLVIPGYMIDHEQASLIIEKTRDSPVYMRSELSIHSS